MLDKRIVVLLVVFCFQVPAVAADTCQRHTTSRGDFFLESRIVKEDSSYQLVMTVENCGNDVEVWGNRLPWNDGDHIIWYGYYLDNKHVIDGVAGIGFSAPEKLLFHSGERLDGKVRLQRIVDSREARNIDDGIDKRGLVYFISYDMMLTSGEKITIADWGIVHRK